MAQIDLRNATIRFTDGGSNFIDVKIGEGTCDYTEKRQIDIVKSRGVLDIVRENEEEAIEVSMSFIWEHITSSGSEPPTVEDALKRVSNASAWVSVTSTDPDAPYCLNLSIIYEPPCTDSNETILISEFHYTDLAHSLKEGTVALKGIGNITEAVATRS